MILKEIYDLVEIGCNAMNVDRFCGMKMMELGVQRMKWNEHKTGKNYFIAHGVGEHVSIDMNGRNGALKIDLSKPIDKWQKYFDMVTNYGTAEHVSPGIYECFKNIHNMTRVGGVMIHAGPPAGGCPWHSPYHYEPWFFEKLAEIAGYGHIMSEVRVAAGRRGVSKPLDRSLVCAVLIKTADEDFISEQVFKDIGGIEGL